MSTEMIAGQAAKLARVRLENLLINATAVPVPADVAQPTDHPAASDQDRPPSSDTTQAARDNDPRAEDHHLLAMPAQWDANSEDALSKSLHAAGDAIHQSLRQGADHSASVFGLSPGASDPGQNIVSAAAHDADVLASSTVGENRSAPTAHEASPSNFDPQNVSHAPLAATENAHAPTAAVTDTALPIVSDALHENGLEPALTNIASDLHGVIGAPLTAVAAPLSDTVAIHGPAEAITTALSSLPPLAVEPVKADSVTVPSLDGAGFDALAGVLHPAPAMPDVAPAAATVQASFDHESILVPIGLEQVFHPDSELSHPLHAGLPPVGSGLI